MLTQTEIQHLAHQIAQHIHPKKIIVFGSYAKGCATPRSDLDLLIIKDTHLPVEVQKAALTPLFAKLLVNVDAHFYTPKEIATYSHEPYSFIASILKTGKTYFEKA